MTQSWGDFVRPQVIGRRNTRRRLNGGHDGRPTPNQRGSRENESTTERCRMLWRWADGVGRGKAARVEPWEGSVDQCFR